MAECIDCCAGKKSNVKKKKKKGTPPCRWKHMTRVNISKQLFRCQTGGKSVAPPQGIHPSIHPSFPPRGGIMLGLVLYQSQAHMERCCFTFLLEDTAAPRTFVTSIFTKIHKFKIPSSIIEAVLWVSAKLMPVKMMYC